MFESISEKLDSVFRKLKGKGLLKEEDLDLALKEVRMALLEADVNFKVVKDFIQSIKSKSLGKEVLESLTPGQQVVKVVHEELCGLLGVSNTRISPVSQPSHSHHDGWSSGLRQDDHLCKAGTLLQKRRKTPDACSL